MRNFARAIRVALRYWPTLVLSMLCSLGVAVIWGGNISALYPVMEVTLAGKSLQQWNEDRIVTTQKRYDELSQKIADTEKQVAKQPDEELEYRLLELRATRQNENAALEAAKRLKPLLVGYLPSDPFQTVMLVMGLLIASTIVKSGLLVCNEWLVARVSYDITRDLRKKIFDRALEFDRATFMGFGTSYFAAQIVYTADSLAHGLAAVLGGAVREPLKVISCLVGAGLICWRLLLISMFIAPLAGFFIYWIGKKLRQVATRVLKRSTGMHEVMLEALGNVQTVQAYTMESHERERFRQSTLDMRNSALRVVLYNTMSKPVIEIFGLGMITTTMLGGAYLILHRETQLFGFTISDEPLTAPAMLIFFGLLIGASDPLRKLGTVMQQINAGIIAADNLYPMLDKPSLIREPESPKALSKPHKSLELTHIDFGYHSDRPILRDVSMRIPRGQTICIVGANGAGKSTLMHLLCRFYDPVAGKIAVDGIDLREVSLHDLRSRIALVTQHTELFNRTVMENIRYGSPEATEEDAIEAAKRAHADEFIRTQLKDGYKTVVGPGGQFLSGGQRQRISLARALLRKPEWLILDEATSQIDMQSELLIRESLADIRGLQTIIIITHREALLELADVIYEVQDGHLVPVTLAQRLAA